jgi:RNA polymerase sigma-70 factor (ECF subfamily)
MFDNSNPYTLRAELMAGLTHYYVSFADGHGEKRETEVSRPVYLEFLRFVKRERNLRRWDERHIENSDLADEAIFDRAVNPPKDMEDVVYENLRDEQLRHVIGKLPKIQRRRFLLHYEFGLTYAQIAEMEGCTQMPVKRSIDKAVTRFQEKIIEI